MKRWAGWISTLVFLALASTVIAAWRGLVTVPFLPSHPELASQLRDRSAIAVAGGVPFGLRREETPLVDVGSYPALASSLAGSDYGAAARALRESRSDGLLVRTDKALGPERSVLRRLSTLRAVPGFTAVYADDTAAVYELRDPPVVEESDARALIDVVRLVMRGAPSPPERLFPESVRRAQPTEVAVILRGSSGPILWRAVRGGSIGRALVDATYAVLDRWGTRQQQDIGTLSDAIQRLPITVAMFYGRGTLGSRSTAFLDRAINPSVFAVGFEHLGRWEYVLPPAPGQTIGVPSQAIANLARERDVQPPGYLRPELTLYRFRALQLIEESPGGPVTVFDPVGD